MGCRRCEKMPAGGVGGNAFNEVQRSEVVGAPSGKQIWVPQTEVWLIILTPVNVARCLRKNRDSYNFYLWANNSLLLRYLQKRALWYCICLIMLKRCNEKNRKLLHIIGRISLICQSSRWKAAAFVVTGRFCPICFSLQSLKSMYNNPVRKNMELSWGGPKANTRLANASDIKYLPVPWVLSLFPASLLRLAGSGSSEGGSLQELYG